MIGTLDSQVIEKFKEFQKKTGKYSDLDIENVEFEREVLNNLIDIFDSQRVPLSTTERNKRKGKYPYYGASGIIDYIDDFIFDGEYLIISEDGENLRSRKTPIAFWATGQFWVNNHAHIVLGKENILYTDYLRLFISSNKLSGFISNSSQPKLSQGNLQKIPIPLPKDFDEKYKSTVIQKAIVEFLEYSFDNLERIRNNIDKRYEIVSKMRKSLIPSTFKRTAIKNRFRKYAKENNIEFDIIDIESDAGVVAFNVDGIFSQDVAVYLDKYNICVRAGNHCAKILKDEVGVKNTCRVSLYFYNTKEEIDKLVELLKNKDKILKEMI